MAEVYHKHLLLADIAGGLRDFRTDGDHDAPLCDVLVVLWDGDRRLGSVELTDALDALTDIERRPDWQRASIRRKYA